MASGSQVRITTGPRDTRRISASPAAGSRHWWIDRVLMAAANAPSGKGRASAQASTAGGRCGGRWARMAAEGSTGVTARSVGS